jgi:hypothetical protein
LLLLASFNNFVKETRVEKVSIMQLAYQYSPPIMKRDNASQKLLELRVSTKKDQFGENRKKMDEILRLNKLAKEYPFCIMYQIKKDDPL